MRTSHFAALASALAAPALAWNADIHQQIGYATEEFLKPETREIIAKILEPEYDGSLGRVAAWADEHRRTDAGSHSTPWHWINSADDAPQLCNTYFNRDCTEGGCVVSALANETQILKGCVRDAKMGKLNNGTDANCAQAVKYITHFTQDIAQPMHVTGIARGGNGVPVVFGGVDTNLHAIWDGRIVYSLANVTAFPTTGIAPFFTKLVEKIRADTFFTPVDEWTRCTTPGTPLACPIAWARDSNEWNCDYAFSQVTNAPDLLTSGYAEGAWPIVEIQMAKAALRTATWFNRLVENCFHERDVIYQPNPSWVGGPNGGA
ncbi:nuclease P1 [Plectosphaerella plurivora]|uniref:Nuclease P1 n=1 Tax=Plectosphaerella plurivora TaxID=936078 RepID=A0A9P8VEJ6_9PEZI|nr:nuclease P1 [Plectosphaerella plurivora]